MNSEEKIEKLKKELEVAEKGLKHMSEEYAATRGGSAYGVEYYDIQIRVYQSMIREIKEEMAQCKLAGNKG